MKLFILSYCLKCKENRESLRPDVLKANDGKIILLSKCAICGRSKRYIKQSRS